MDRMNGDGGSSLSSSGCVEGGVTLSWSDLSVTMQGVARGKRFLLQSAAGYAEPGTLLAIMAPSGSGSGKTLSSSSSSSSSYEYIGFDFIHVLYLMHITNMATHTWWCTMNLGCGLNLQYAHHDNTCLTWYYIVKKILLLLMIHKAQCA